jgi:tRNA pseudouridine55 synthase
MLKNIFPIYKPKGPTSHDIVDQVRRVTGVKKVGHAGTLDPLAEGVLVVAVGREATKQISSIVKTEKEYIAEIKLGETSTTDDEEGEKNETPNSKIQIPKETIVEALKGFVGEIEQIPPIYSAIKVKGKSAYKYARKGEDLKLEPRNVLIKEIQVLKYEWPILELRVVSGSGVYIRSLARDVGEKLGVGGYLASLKRTRVGEYKIEDSINPNQVVVQLSV